MFRTSIATTRNAISTSIGSTTTGTTLAGSLPLATLFILLGFLYKMEA